jgi:hypothetical protein
MVDRGLERETGSNPRPSAVGAMKKRIIVAPGTIDILTANTNATGACKWALTYIPLDDGAYVVAA